MPISTRQIDNVDTLPPGSQVGEVAPWQPLPRARMGWAEIVAAGGVGVVLVLVVWWLIGADVRFWISYSWGGMVIKAAFGLGFLFIALAGIRRTLLVDQRGYKVPIWDVRHVIPQLIEVDSTFAGTPGRMVRAQTISYPQKFELPAPAAVPQLDTTTITTIPMLPPAEWLTWVDTRPHGLLAAETGGGKSTTVKAVLKSRMDRGELVFLIDPHSSDWFGLPSIGGGEDWAAVWCGMRVVIEEYTRRMQERDLYLKQNGHELPHDRFTRINVLLDEANTACRKLSIAKRGEESKWEQFAEALGSGARKVGLSIQLLAQSANVEDIGLSGPMRQNFTRICLDAATTRLMIQREETDNARKRELHEALAGVDYPATAVQRGQVVLLDRRGLDQIGPPANARAALWAEGYERTDMLLSGRQIGAQPARAVVSASARPSASVSTAFSLDGLLEAPTAPGRTADGQRTRLYLKAMAAAGKTREYARERMLKLGMPFENKLWTEVRRELGLSE